MLYLHLRVSQKKVKVYVTITFAGMGRLVCGAVWAHAAHGGERRVPSALGLAENLRHAPCRRATGGVVGLNAAKYAAPRAAVVLPGHAGLKLSAGAAASRGHVWQGGTAVGFHAQALRLCAWGMAGAPRGAVHMCQLTCERSRGWQAQCQNAKSHHNSSHALHAKGAGQKPRAHMFDQVCHSSAFVDDALGLAERTRQAGVLGHVD